MSEPSPARNKLPVPELRRDPVTGRPVIIASNRADRPNEFLDSETPRADKADCPFCAGQLRTPPAVATYCLPDGADWQVRVVPNLYPALTPDDSHSAQSAGFFQSAAAVGRHEVVIESPRHLASLQELTDEQVALVFRAYRDRLRAASQDEQVVFCMPFKNSDHAAGASLAHVHSQIVGLPIVPPHMLEELQGADRRYRQSGHCVFCRMIGEEVASEKRLIARGDTFVAFCPFASRFPYEVWVLPCEHSASFTGIDERQLGQLGRLIRRLVTQLQEQCGIRSYNYVVHSAPFDISHTDHYHWHIEFIPRIAKVAGFEWGTGVHMNSVAPEQAARQLRCTGLL